VQGAITVKIEDKLSCRRPKDPSERSGLLEIETTACSDDAGNFKISLLSQVVFSFDEVPENFETTMQESCYPLAKAKISEAVKVITGAMGLNPLDLG